MSTVCLSLSPRSVVSIDVKIEECYILDTLDWNKYHKSCPVSPVGEHGTVWESMPAAGSINHILSKWLSWKTFFSQPGAKQGSDTERVE